MKKNFSEEKSCNSKLLKLKAFRNILSVRRNEKVIKTKFNNKEATDDMNIFQCPFPDCKRNYFNLKDWGVHYRYHVSFKK